MNLPTTPPAARSRKPALRLRTRPDLVAVETRHKHDSAIVVKDPIALKYHRLRPDEFFVLQTLDGLCSLDQIRDAYEQRFAPTKVTEVQLNQLLFRFHQSGLTLSDAPLQGDRLTDRRIKQRNERWMQHINGILFMRFPGVDPEPLLRRLHPLAKPLLSRIGCAVAIVICVAAAIVFAGEYLRFAGEFPQMSQWLRLESLLILACVIGGTKILHELGHAITCKHFGGECHQIGPMLLVFTPALYCDTSDSWMLPNRWQRAAVGLAGIATEVLLAAIATFIWASSAPGLTHYVAMNVMLVCSVSTLMFNANPLLRYDGYYVLSDICDVPNLGDKSRKLLSAHSAQLFLGVEEDDGEIHEGASHVWMFIYALASFVYRWSLTLLILWFVSLILRPYGLESLGRVLCLFAAIGLVVSLFRVPVRFLRNPARRRLIKMKRVSLSAACLACFVVAACWPFPSGVPSPGRIVPREETPVYISTAGQLGTLNVDVGSMVSEGDEIATLVNPDVELQYLQSKGRFEAQEQVVEAIRLSLLDHPDAANELPGAKALLADFRKQLETRTSRRDGLVLRSPSSGRLIAAPRRPQDVSSDAEAAHLVNWSGYPTDPENAECYLESGSELVSVAVSDDWDAEITMDQNQVQRISPGNAVKVALESMPAVTFEGVVTDISRMQWQADQNVQRRDDPNAARREQPLSTSYLVRVQLSPPENLQLMTGATATTRIEASPISLFGRVKRLLNGMFRFR